MGAIPEVPVIGENQMHVSMQILIAIVNLQCGFGDVESARQATPVHAKYSGQIER